MTTDLGALLACAVLVSARAVRVATLRPLTLALATLALLHLAALAGDPRLAVFAFAAWPAPVAALLLRRRAHPLLVVPPALIYAAAVARFGAVLAPVWPLPILAPNLLPLALLVVLPRPRTWAERAAYVPAASGAGDVVATWALADPTAGVVLGVATWALVGALALLEAYAAPRSR